MKNDTLDNVIKEFSDGTYDFTYKGKCVQCGNCCSNLLPMTEKEIDSIKKYIKQHKIKEHKHLVPLANVTLDLTCPFLDDSKSCEKCTIYEVRPRICREFSCDPNQRTKLDPNYAIQCKPIDVREEFFR